MKRIYQTREGVRVCVSKTRTVGCHLNCIFRTTKAYKHTALADHDSKGLGIKLFCFDIVGESQDRTSYKPLPKADLPVMDWSKVQFSEWTEDYSAESRHLIEITLQTVSNMLWLAVSNDVNKIKLSLRK